MEGNDSRGELLSFVAPEQLIQLSGFLRLNMEREWDGAIGMMKIKPAAFKRLQKLASVSSERDLPSEK